MEQDVTYTLNIPHITSALTIGNNLQIDMRQRSGAELSFVSLSNGASSTRVTIDGNGRALGDYELILESFDQASGVFSTLKTNRIMLTV